MHLLSGGTWAAIELCSNNIQMSVAPSLRSQTIYFAIACAIAGVTGALGTAVGGFLAQLDSIGGLPGLFALSAILRLVALLPLVFVREQGSQGLMKFWQLLNISRQRKPLLPKAKAVTIPVTELANRSK